MMEAGKKKVRVVVIDEKKLSNAFHYIIFYLR